MNEKIEGLHKKVAEMKKAKEDLLKLKERPEVDHARIDAAIRVIELYFTGPEKGGSPTTPEGDVGQTGSTTG